MSNRTAQKSTSRRPARDQTESPTSPWRITCGRCDTPIMEGQRINPVFPTKALVWSEHPVLSKAPVIRGFLPTDGSPGQSDLSLHDQLRQRAAMGGEKERAEL